MRRVKTINVSLAEESLKDLDNLREVIRATSRSEVIRRLIDEAKRHGWLDGLPETGVAAAIGTGNDKPTL